LMLASGPFSSAFAISSWAVAVGRQPPCLGIVVRIKAGQSVLLASTSSGSWLQLSLADGYCRICDSEVTLGFVGPGDLQLVRIPAGCVACLEALTDVSVSWRDPGASFQASEELLGDWMAVLLRVRSHPQAGQRLVALFQGLLCGHGRRTSEGYWLPFALSHLRLAELVGSTRSTVTRVMCLLRQRSTLLSSDEQMGLVFDPAFLED
jgi:hypothetical protein